MKDHNPSKSSRPPLTVCLFPWTCPQFVFKGLACVFVSVDMSRVFCLKLILPLNSDRFPFEERGPRAQATRLERNDGSTVTASGLSVTLGLNSHTPPSAVHTARCVPRRIACVRTDACVNGGVWPTFAGHRGNFKLQLQAAKCGSPICSRAPC